MFYIFRLQLMLVLCVHLIKLVSNVFAIKFLRKCVNVRKTKKPSEFRQKMTKKV